MKEGGAVQIMLHALYGAVQTIFGLFGLKPIWALYFLGVLLVVGLITQLRMAFKERSSWTFDPDKTPRRRDFQG